MEFDIATGEGFASPFSYFLRVIFYIFPEWGSWTPELPAYATGYNGYLVGYLWHYYSCSTLPFLHRSNLIKRCYLSTQYMHPYDYVPQENEWT